MNDFLEDSIDIFNQPRMCFCNPGQVFEYEGIPIRICADDQHSLMAHYVWRSSVVMAKLIDSGQIESVEDQSWNWVLVQGCLL